MPYPAGRWHGSRFMLGLHYDLHATENDTALGEYSNPASLVPMLERFAPDFVQTDCKGHPGYTSWFSETPGAAVPPGLRHDVLRGWRDATKQMGLPLHCHYSGIWDFAAAQAHPDWAVVPAPAVSSGKNTDWTGKICPRSAYVDELVIPQFKELVDRYAVDGVWVDGDLWAAEPCYCARCLAAWTAEGNADAPPAEPGAANWADWWQFTLRSFEAYVTRYCDALRAYAPQLLVCSNWLYTSRNAGDPNRVPVDWISGDNATQWAVDACRVEARFLSTRGKPWDIMIWSFYKTRWNDSNAPFTLKGRDFLCQELVPILVFGGNVQIYEGGLRDGRLVPWRMERLGEAAEFARAPVFVPEHRNRAADSRSEQ